jgi:hypothetical protein
MLALAGWTRCASAEDEPTAPTDPPPVVETPPPPTANPPPPAPVAPAPPPIVNPYTPYAPYGYEARRPRREWYGWQTLLVDGAALAMVYAAADQHTHDAPTLAYVALGTNVLGPPVVHWAHGNVGRGLGSLLIRGGSWALVFAAIAGNGSDNASVGLFGVLGILAAPAIDAAVLAYEDPKPSVSTPPFALAAAPWVTKTSSGLAMSATF